MNIEDGKSEDIVSPTHHIDTSSAIGSLLTSPRNHPHMNNMNVAVLKENEGSGFDETTYKEYYDVDPEHSYIKQNMPNRHASTINLDEMTRREDHGIKLEQSNSTKKIPNWHVPNSSNLHAKKGSEDVGGSSVLRYALHLRFVCPSLRTPRKAKEAALNCSSVSMDSQDNLLEDKRRFYLYGDLRVVFPQRQSDSDEGKVGSIGAFPLFLHIQERFFSVKDLCSIFMFNGLRCINNMKRKIPNLDQMIAFLRFFLQDNVNRVKYHS